MTKTTITTSNADVEKGDKLRIQITNSFWEVLYHFILRKNLRRYDTYTVTCVNSGTCFEVENE